MTVMLFLSIDSNDNHLVYHWSLLFYKGGDGFGVSDSGNE